MRILNFGSLNLDHTYRLDHLVLPGETISAESYTVYCGGKGHNQSIALARAGADVCHAGLVGADGGRIHDSLEGSGVDIRHLRTVDTPTGHALIQVDKEGQNSIIVYAGANGKIDAAYAEQVLRAFGDDDYLLLQNEISGMPEIMELAHRRGLRIVLNPSPCNEALMRCPLEHVWMFVVNELEGESMSGQTEPKAICEAICARYPGASVLLTLGDKGSLYYAAGKEIRQPPHPADVVDSTAAGDTFTGYFLAWLLRGADIQDALKAASVAASIAISRPGAAVSIPARAMVLSRMDT